MASPRLDGAVTLTIQRDIHPATHRNLKKFAAQYFQRFEDLSWPPPKVLRELKHQQWLWHNVFRPAPVTCSTPVAYQNRVLKRLLDKIQSAVATAEDPEICDELMEYYAALSTKAEPSEISAAMEKQKIEYTVSGNILHIRHPHVYLWEKPSLIAGSGTTGYRTWPAALHLSTFLTTSAGRRLVEGKRLVELGAGTGLVSLVSLVLGAETVLATDGDEHIVDAIFDNTMLNTLHLGSLTPRLHSEVLEWNNPRSLLEGLDRHSLTIEHPPPSTHHRPIDLVLGADILYDPTSFQGLAASIVAFLTSERHPTVLIAAPMRSRATMDTFQDICLSMNLRVSEIYFECPPAERQDGLFHKHDVNIVLLQVEKNGRTTLR